MAEAVVCKLCHTRRAKRACPAVGGDICALCCGEQREVILSCPLDCMFLREAHKHEKTVEIPVGAISNPEVEVTEDFIRSQEELLLFCIYALLQAALRTQGAVDTDVLEAVDAIIRTYRTAESGLVYETRPTNMVAAAIQQKMTNSIKEYETEQTEETIINPVRHNPDSHIFPMLVFLHRIGQQNLNGRPKGRMFLDMLRGMTPDIGVDERAPSIII